MEAKKDGLTVPAYITLYCCKENCVHRAREDTYTGIINET